MKHCNKFIQFVEDNKDSVIRRVRINYNLRKKKDFILSEKDIDTVYEGVKTVYPNIKSMFESTSLSDEDFEDIFQNSVMALYNNIGTNIECSLNTYFYNICYRQTLKYLKSRKGIVSVDLNDPSLDVKAKNGISAQRLNQIIQTIPAGKVFPNTIPSPDKDFDLSLMKELVHKALNEMAGKCRQLLMKFYIEGYSWTEIAIDYKLKDAVSAKASANRCRRRFEEKYKGLKNFGSSDISSDIMTR